MSLLDFLTAPQNTVFLFFLSIGMFIFFLEIISLLLGGAVDAFFDGFLPESDVDVSVAGGFLGLASTWFLLGRLPFLMWLTIYIMGFAVWGFVLQAFFASFYSLLSSLIAIPVAVIISFAISRFVISKLSKVFNQPENHLISDEGLIGCVATITLVSNYPHHNMTAHLVDPNGAVRVLYIKPRSGVSFSINDEVVLKSIDADGVFEAMTQDEYKKLISI